MRVAATSTRSMAIPVDPMPVPGSLGFKTFFALPALFALFLLAANVSNAEPAHLGTTNDLLGGGTLGSSDTSKLRPLGDLLFLPDSDYIWQGDATDEDLAYAVILGNDPDLERRNPFRKHSFDLIRTQHPLVIGQREMVVRFRVRPKLKEVMSVELKF